MALLLVTISLGESMHIKHYKVVQFLDNFKLLEKRSANVSNLLMQILSHQEERRNGSNNRKIENRMTNWPIFWSKGQNWGKYFQNKDNEKLFNGMSLLRM